MGTTQTNPAQQTQQNKPSGHSSGASAQASEVAASSGASVAGISVMHQEGVQQDYTPGGDTAGGTIVDLGGYIGLVSRPVAAGELGAVACKGIVKIPNSGIAPTRGTPVDVNIGNQTVVTTALGTLHAGIVAYDAAAEDSHVAVWINERVGV